MTRAHRLRAAIGSALIGLATRIMPPMPNMDEATAQRIYQRIISRSALERMGDRRNGHHRNTPIRPI